METLTILFLGFLTGMKHALDSDHIAAVSTLVSRHKKLSSAVWAGGWWGAGHTITLVAVGFIVLLFGLNIPPGVESGLESIVGLMLILLGAVNFKMGFFDEFHLHKHLHDDHEHLHLHRHEEGKKPHDHRHSHSYNLKALIVGSVHGMAGSAALMLLVVATIKSVPIGLIYILFFGIGSIAGMILFSLILSLPLSLAGNRMANMSRLVTMGSGIFSILIGFLILKETFHSL